jgi:hypothetical protein
MTMHGGWYNNFNIVGTIQIDQLPVVTMVGSNVETVAYEGAQAIPLGSVLVDHAGNATTGRFVAPAPGLYSVEFGANFSALQDGLTNGHVQLCRDADSNVICDILVDSSITTQSISSSRRYIAHLAAGQSLYVVASNAVVYIAPPPHMTAHLLTTTFGTAPPPPPP